LGTIQVDLAGKEGVEVARLGAIPHLQEELRSNEISARLDCPLGTLQTGIGVYKIITVVWIAATDFEKLLIAHDARVN
jgi:hypothetical protein